MFAPQLEIYRTAQGSPGSDRGIESAALAQPATLPADSRRTWESPGRTPYAPQIEAYRSVQNSNASGREIEAAALTRCALLLADCRKYWDDPSREEMLSQALRTNQKVWSILQSELTRRDNPLPRAIKENILSLSLFIDKRILEVMAYPETGKLKILIDINLNLAAGLRSKPAE